jgi:hypothetical protein
MVLMKRLGDEGLRRLLRAGDCASLRYMKSRALCFDNCSAGDPTGEAG